MTSKSIKERRKALGWTLEQAAEACREGLSIAPESIRRMEGDGIFHGCSRTRELCERAYDAALTAEEKRRVRDEAREVLAACREAQRVGSRVWPRWSFTRDHFPALADAWGGSQDSLRGPTANAILTALAKLAEDPEAAPEKVATWSADVSAWVLSPAYEESSFARRVSSESREDLERWGYRIVGGPETPAEPALAITDEMRADAREALRYSAMFHFARKHLGAPDHPSARPTTGTPAYEALRQRVQAIADSEPEPVADTDPMPTPPEGSGLSVLAMSGCWLVRRDERDGYGPNTLAIVQASGRLDTYNREDMTTAARYAADLAEWAARQHTRTHEAERQRLRDAVREAEEAELTAADAKDEAWKAYDATLAPLGRAREALWAAREAARKGGAL